MRTDLAGQICLVSGGSLGMGRETAKELYEEGAKVLICARREPLLAEAKKLIESSGGSGQIEYVVADMSSAEGIQKAIDACRKFYGAPPLRVVANVIQSKFTYSFDEATEAEFLRSHDELVMSVVRLVKAVLPAMIEQKFGRFVNLGTVAIKEPHRWHHLYGNSYRIMAHAVLRGLANEYAIHNITFNTVSPGLIDTGISDWLLKDAESKGHVRREEQPVIFAGRPGQPDEVSGMIVFCLSDRSSYLTGQNLTIDGAWTRCLM